MTEEVDTPARTERIPFDALGSFPALFRDYMTRFERLSTFFARDWRSPADRAEAARAAAEHPRDRETLVTVLAEQQESWGRDGDPSRLLDPRSAAVVTGQQVGLFTGPLYTVLKAMTTVRLARHLEAETGRPVVPVFWLGSEDHDFAEMSVATLPSGDGMETIRYDGHEPPAKGNLGPVGALELADAIGAALERVSTLLPDTEFRERLLDAVRGAYAPGTSFRDAFARLLRALLPHAGLVLVSADDVRLKRLALPLWRREITHGEALHENLRATSLRLEGDWHAQVRTSPTNLFVLHEGARLPLDREGDRYRIRTTGETWDARGVLDLLERDPARFTPNVVLRPLTQDWLLPTAATVGGPGEISYFAQLGGAYEWAGVPMPVIHPRSSVTLVEPRIRRVLGRLGLGPGAFSLDVEALFSRLVVEQLRFDMDARFEAARRAVGEAIDRLSDPIVTVDRSLERTVEAARAAAWKELDRLRERVLRSERRRHDDLRTQVLRVAGALFPGGIPQERVVSPLWYAALFGPSFLPELMERLDPFATDHQVIDC